ncbi:MAG: transporter [Rickettsiaceae bacterium H1]|nr:transporter [Rickettsiaceae bacterium H1]
MFLSILLKILPLYLIIFTGFIAGKTIKTDRDVIAKFLFFIITPIVIFTGVVKMQNNNLMIILLPFIVYLISCVMCSIMYKISSKIFHSSIRNIIAFSSGSANTGHFGLPIALIVLDHETVAIYIVSFLGITLFENTYGFYVAAKGYFNAFDCIKKIFKLPALYAIMIGLTVNYNGYSIPPILQDFCDSIRSTYIVLGMSTIGLGISVAKFTSIDWKIVGSTLIAKYIVWPLLMGCIVLSDKYYFHIYGTSVHTALMILSIVPISVSTIVVGSVLKYPSEQLIWILLISTSVGLIYVPAMLSLLINVNLL